MSLMQSDVRFPLYAISGADFFVLNDMDSLEKEFEPFDLGAKGNVELYDAAYRAVKVKSRSVYPVVSWEYQLLVDDSQEAVKSSLWFRHSLIEVCLARDDLGLANGSIFCAEIETLITDLCKRLGYS